MALPHFLSGAVETWAAYYDHHQLVSVSIRFLHLTGLVLGGGTALAADRQVLKALRAGPSGRANVVPLLDAAHRVVVPGLALMIVTGLLMTATDTETFFASRLYWTKLGLVGLLLLNGLGLLLAERAVSGDKPRGWLWLGLTSGVSLLLWLVILFAGVWLTVAA